MSDFSDELSQPPSTFHIDLFLKKIVDDPSHDSYRQSLQSAASYAQVNLDLFHLLSGTLWCWVSALFEDHLSKNCDDLHITNREFTWATGKLHQLFLTHEYRSNVVSAFGVTKESEIDDGQRSLSASLLLCLYQLFLRKLVKLTCERGEAESVSSVEFDVYDMSAEGQGKVQYIGWMGNKEMPG
ncbi:Hypothetical predicted protein [Paramuricea clavata]|uniref:Uncharacterized protein n=1 Tax=Paramuricea clavata TaxID=317549 RepID=A0A7D9IXR1_PARCT|nr:Hypothetical predicted protein [Paramuricea clavata]